MRHDSIQTKSPAGVNPEITPRASSPSRCSAKRTAFRFSTDRSASSAPTSASEVRAATEASSQPAENAHGSPDRFESSSKNRFTIR